MFAGLRYRFRLNAMATSELSSLGPSTRRAKVVGKARPGKQLLVAPITGRSCVFYSVDIGEWFNGNKTPLLSEASKALFQIEDQTGTALVNPALVRSLLKASRKRGHSGTYLNEHRTLLKRNGLTMLDAYGELRSLAFSETIIAPNDEICVLGAVEQRADPNGVASYREQPQQAVLQRDGDTALLVCKI